MFLFVFIVVAVCFHWILRVQPILDLVFYTAFLA